jgi:hypothetical protein
LLDREPAGLLRGVGVAKGKADISNFAVRVLLQRVGAHYDEVRGFAPYRKAAHFQTIREFFDDRCCFCGVDLESTSPNQDHLIPLNRQHLGLEAWGNIVPACAKCNGRKQGKDWRDFLGEVAAEDFKHRAERIRAFQREYRYEPKNEDIRELAESLYDEAGAIVMALIEIKIHRAEHVIDGVHSEKR